MRDVLWRTSNSLDGQSLPKQWLRRIGHLRPLRASTIWVVERGIKKWCRSIAFHTMSLCEG